MLLIFLPLLLAQDSQVGGKLSPDGHEQIQIDLPALQHLKNTGGGEFPYGFYSFYMG